MSEGFRVFLEKLSQFGLEYFRVYPGVYRALVTRNDDPEQRGRIQIVSPEVGHKQSDPPNVWVDPSFPNAGTGHGMFWPPEVGDSVRVAFEAGRPSKPVIYWGGWYGEDEVPSELGHRAQDLPTVRGFKTPGGHVLAFSDEPGEEFIHLIRQEDGASFKLFPDDTFEITNPNGAKVTGNADGSLVVENGSGNKLTFDNTGIRAEDAAGNKVTMQAGSVVIDSKAAVKLGEGATSPAMKFADWLPMFAAHSHQVPGLVVAVPVTSPPGTPSAGTAAGVTGPPIPTTEGTVASRKVFLE
jgi:hypothetical protein